MIQIEWDSPSQRFLYFTFGGRWTWDELNVALEHGKQLTVDVTRPFCMVIHLDDIARMHVPPNVFSYAHMTHRVSVHVVKTIIVNSNSIGIGIMSIMFRLYPELKNYYVFVPTLEDAERIVAQVSGQSSSTCQTRKTSST